MKETGQASPFECVPECVFMLIIASSMSPYATFSDKVWHYLTAFTGDSGEFTLE